MQYKNKKITGINVYTDNRKSRTYVGRLCKKGNDFHFKYDKKYLYAKSSIPLGPELSITQKEYSSRNLFVSFLDRIPSKENPAYPEYCEKFGISTDEKNPFILLSTIARKGPSSFVFEPVYEEYPVYDEVRTFRKDLNVSIRDFAIVFDVSPVTVHKIESNKTSGKEVLKRLEIYKKFPEVALFEIQRNATKINENVKDQLIQLIKQKIADVNGSR